MFFSFIIENDHFQPFSLNVIIISVFCVFWNRLRTSSHVLAYKIWDLTSAVDSWPLRSYRKNFLRKTVKTRIGVVAKNTQYTCVFSNRESVITENRLL